MVRRRGLERLFDAGQAARFEPELSTKTSSIILPALPRTSHTCSLTPLPAPLFVLCLIHRSSIAPTWHTRHRTADFVSSHTRVAPLSLLCRAWLLSLYPPCRGIITDLIAAIATHRPNRSPRGHLALFVLTVSTFGLNSCRLPRLHNARCDAALIADAPPRWARSLHPSSSSVACAWFVLASPCSQARLLGTPLERLLPATSLSETFAQPYCSITLIS